MRRLFFALVYIALAMPTACQADSNTSATPDELRLSQCVWERVPATAFLLLDKYPIGIDKYFPIINLIFDFQKNNFAKIKNEIGTILMTRVVGSCYSSFELVTKNKKTFSHGYFQKILNENRPVNYNSIDLIDPKVFICNIYAKSDKNREKSYGNNIGFGDNLSKGQIFSSREIVYSTDKPVGFKLSKNPSPILITGGFSPEQVQKIPDQYVVDDDTAIFDCKYFQSDGTLK